MTRNFRKKMLATVAGAALCLGLCPAAYAVQTLAVKDGDSVAADVSLKELTRFSMADGGRITKIWGPDDRFSVEPDKEGGQLFVRMADNKNKEPFSVFVKDDGGNTYTVLATPTAMPSGSVVLQGGGSRQHKAEVEAEGHGFGAGAYSPANGRPYNWVSTLKELERRMALDTLRGAVRPEADGSSVDIGLPGRLVRLERYNGDLTGEVYGFTANSPVTLDERQFRALGSTGNGIDGGGPDGPPGGQSVKAVAIDNLRLAAGESTRIYVALSAGDGL